MDTLLKSVSTLSHPLLKQPPNSNNLFIIRNGHSSFIPISSIKLLGRNSNSNSSSSNRRRRSLMVEAKKGYNNDKKRKNDHKLDTHSFASKPDESTGPFPEAVLLKQKKVQEDGRVLPEFADEDEEELFEFLNLELESDLDADQMRHYEVVYLIHQDHKDKVDDVNTKIRDFLREKKGRVWRFSDWGMRRLAYKIQKATHAHYILMNFEIGTQWINEFKQMLDQDERVIRHLVMKRDKAIRENCPPPPEFHTLRADMVDEYEVDDDDEDDEEYDDGDEDIEEGDDLNAEDEDINDVQETEIQTGKSNTKREKVFM